MTDTTGVTAGWRRPVLFALPFLVSCFLLALLLHWAVPSPDGETFFHWFDLEAWMWFWPASALATVGWAWHTSARGRSSLLPWVLAMVPACQAAWRYYFETARLIEVLGGGWIQVVDRPPMAADSLSTESVAHASGTAVSMALIGGVVALQVVSRTRWNVGRMLIAGALLLGLSSALATDVQSLRHYEQERASLPEVKGVTSPAAHALFELEHATATVSQLEETANRAAPILWLAIALAAAGLLFSLFRGGSRQALGGLALTLALGFTASARRHADGVRAELYGALRQIHEMHQPELERLVELTPQR